MTDLPPATPPAGTTADRSPVLRQVLRWGLVVGWVLWAALAWWCAPREADHGRLDRDLAAGAVVTFQRADGWTGDRGFWGRQPEPRYAPQGSLIVWTSPSGQVHVADLGFTVAGPEEEADDGYDRRLNGVADPWRTDGAPAHRIADAAVLLAGAISLLWLGVLVGGPAPVTGTRWFWFWIGLLPFGLGILAWLYRERRRPADATLPVARHTGWLGIAWSILGAIMLAVLVAGLRDLLGGTVVPG